MVLSRWAVGLAVFLITCCGGQLLRQVLAGNALYSNAWLSRGIVSLNFIRRSFVWHSFLRETFVWICFVWQRAVSQLLFSHGYVAELSLA